MKKIIILILITLLASCTSNETIPTANDDVNSPSTSLTCSSAISKILEQEQNFERVIDTSAIIYQRGGAYNNQLMVDFTNQKITIGNESNNYYSSLAMDEYFRWIWPDGDSSEYDEIDRQETIAMFGDQLKTIDFVNNTITYSEVPAFDHLEWIENHPFYDEYDDHDIIPSYVQYFHNYDIGFVNDSYKLFTSLNSKLFSVGCPLINLTITDISSYDTKFVSNEDYWHNDLITDPYGLIQDIGKENLVQENSNYLELDHWEDYKNIDPFITLDDGTRLNVGFIIVIYNNEWMTAVPKMDDGSNNPFYKVETFATLQLLDDSFFHNPMFLQNYFRDIWYPYALGNAPKVYFYNAANEPTNKFSNYNTNTSPSILSEATSIEEFNGNSQAVFEFKPMDDGVEFIGKVWVPYQNALEMLRWYSKYLQPSTFSYDFWEEYWHVYDFEWQKEMGIREVYIEKYGPFWE